MSINYFLVVASLGFFHFPAGVFPLWVSFCTSELRLQLWDLQEVPSGVFWERTHPVQSLWGAAMVPLPHRPLVCLEMGLIPVLAEEWVGLSLGNHPWNTLSRAGFPFVESDTFESLCREMIYLELSFHRCWAAWIPTPASAYFQRVSPAQL